MFRDGGYWLATDVSGLHIGPIIKGQASKNFYHTVLGMRDAEETDVSEAHTAFIFSQAVHSSWSAYPDIGGITILRNVVKYLPVDTALHSQ